MPRMNPLSRPKKHGDESKLYLIDKNGTQLEAVVLQRRPEEVYVHYVNTDKRMDEWRAEEDIMELETNGGASAHMAGRKRKRGTSAASASASCERSIGSPGMDVQGVEGQGDAPMTEEELDLREHRKITAKRNFDKVNFGHWQIKTWYFSPYPVSDADVEDVALTAPANKLPPASGSGRIHNVNKTTLRAHGRTSDLFVGGLGRANASGEKGTLWVCDRCFKYMREGSSLELHSKSCHARNPPGRKVYQRGAHIIWEVDGAKEKLFCQNLSLFGKLFIDIKTLFFDCDNFLFYLMTDADSQRDHVLAFFSKEKLSYDDYNLACIVTLPPYQRKGYGMLLIEFSYELSRRSGKLGTPERPLSDLGLRSYLTYWIATLVRFFRRVLSVVPSEIPQVGYSGNATTPDLMRSISKSIEDNNLRLKLKKSKGWDGEREALYNSQDVTASPDGFDEMMLKSMRHTRTTYNPDGSATTHVIVKCTLADISNATHLRVDDVAFALHECGLLSRKKTLEGKDGAEELIAISREMVEAVATERRVKRMCMDVQHVLL